MSAVLSAPLSAKKPIEAIFAEISEVVAILRETRQALALWNDAPRAHEWADAAFAVTELKLREQNCLTLLRGLRTAAIYELDAECAA